MSSNQNEFESLRKLLALKRHELPPPGYFNRLPDKITDRIDRGDGKSNFLQNVIESWAVRPAMAMSCALAAFSALTLSVIYTIKPQEAGPRPMVNGWQSGNSEALANQYNPSERLHVPNWAVYENSSNPAPASSLFDTTSHPPAQSVKFQYANPP